MKGFFFRLTGALVKGLRCSSAELAYEKGLIELVSNRDLPVVNNEDVEPGITKGLDFWEKSGLRTTPLWSSVLLSLS